MYLRVYNANGALKTATNDLSDADIKTAYENNADTNEFDDAEQAGLTNLLAAIDASAATGTEIIITPDLVTFPGDIIARTINGLILEYDIGTAGQNGFGVGICPGPLPSGMSELMGTRLPSADEYGNYQFSDGSIVVWIPAFYYKYGTGANGFAINVVDIKSYTSYDSVADANTAGYALHRAFYDNGAVQSGVFVDKYLCSNNSGTASSIKNGNPLSSNSAHNPFAGLTGAPANNYGGAVDAAKTRGTGWFCSTRFIHAALALLSVAHGQAATATTWCAWYDAAGITNFPKGCNDNALGDINDGSILYTTDGYSSAGKTGSANLFSRTTHNGQNCGVCDQNGVMWEISPGLTSNGTNYYLLNTSAKVSDLTSSNTLATDFWGAAGVAAHSDDLGTAYAALWATAANRSVGFGGAAQTLSEAVSGNAWNAAGAGIPLVTGGANLFGNDNLWDHKPNEMCPLAGGHWGGGSNAGVWALDLSTVRAASYYSVGCRAALYL